MDRRRILLVVAVVVAALGAALVFVYAQGADDRAQEDVSTVDVLVATQQINPGESAAEAFDAGKIVVDQVPSDDVLDGATDDSGAFDDTVALTTIYQGEQILTAKFGPSEEVQPAPLVTAPKGKGSMQVALDDPNRVGSFLQAGARVAIFQVPCGARPAALDGDTQNNYDAARARVILPDMLVLGVGATTVSTPAVTADDGTTAPVQAITSVTLAVSQDEANILGGVGYESAAPLFFVLKDENTDITSVRDLPLTGSCQDTSGQ